MHPRGEVILPNGSKIARASVWIEQEIAIAAFLNNQMKRSLRIAAYVHKDVALEGLRQFIILNPKKFESSEDILNDLPSTLSSWNDFPKEGEDSLERFRDICASKNKAILAHSSRACVTNSSSVGTKSMPTTTHSLRNLTPERSRHRYKSTKYQYLFRQ